MTHAHAPLTPTGRLRMVQRHLNDGIPQAHVAAEFRVARPTVATWVARYHAEGEAGLLTGPGVRAVHLPSSTPGWWLRSRPCLAGRSARPAGSITTSSPRATGCVFVPWDGGCTGPGSAGYGT
ncbi:hypothetical protein MICRO80W_110015 [Micrococcus luteus]|nr:hypothetical protein MICRO80W_110015 [Micrococcus luteus]